MGVVEARQRALAVADLEEAHHPALVGACIPEHGIADDAATRQAKLAVDSRAFPPFTYDPRRGPTMHERLSLQGNPALRSDWASLPDGTPVDFLAFARTQGRFAPHFGPDGTPTSDIEATQRDRLANWRGLRELAGLLRPEAAPPGRRAASALARPPR